MLNLEDIRAYLPKYLSPDTEERLLQDLNDFPRNIDNRIYGFIGKETNILYQGDGINDMLVIHLPSMQTERHPCLILSNTCDMDLSNRRKFVSNIVYAPIMKLEKYKQLLLDLKIFSLASIDGHISAIKSQLVTQIFFLPSGQYLDEDSIVFLDKLISCDYRSIDRENLNKIRIFSLSQYGLYLFLYKLSIHFTRLQENVDRKY